ncbi:MAG: hypothetical protein M1818_004389 [Claussenomyces sp. TS43310]|nr:MAG: hypothetical protein M1818_004389 [Claussenomyces sp. TS43310]
MSSPSSTGTADDFEIIHIPHTPEGIAHYLPLYRSFRLLSLHLAPEAFASKYATEAAFPDEIWQARLSNPSANTFLALRAPASGSAPEQPRVLSSSTMLGPLPYGPDVVSPLGNPWTALAVETEEVAGTRPLHFRLNAVFTLAGERKRGISRALILKAMGVAAQEANARGKGIVISVVVEEGNVPAKKLYEKCGYRTIEVVQKEGADEMPLEQRMCCLLVWEGEYVDGLSGQNLS